MESSSIKDQFREISEMNDRKQPVYISTLFYIFRITALLTLVFVFVPGLNPARISGLVDKTQSLLTSGLSYGLLTKFFVRALTRGWVSKGLLVMLYLASMGGWLGVFGSCAGASMSLGESRLKRIGLRISAAGSVLSLFSSAMILLVYNLFTGSPNVDRLEPAMPGGLSVFIVLNIFLCLLSVLLLVILPKSDKAMKLEMKPKYRLFLMLMPFLGLAFVFSYLPLWGWAVSFFDYRAGFALSADRFVGFKWFTYLFQNEATRADIFRVLRNTLAMSGLGLATSWVAMAFAIFLMEIKSKRYRRFIQTMSTVPNFISWVLIYSFALAMFASEGLLNRILMDLDKVQAPLQFLQSSRNIWLKMLIWGMWKGTGWSAIIYIAAITSIDPQLFEAATVDGAGRFQKIRYITIPSLLPTYFVLLLLSIAGILSNGMEQYYVFKNAMNKDTIEVLDLYVYVLGLGSGGASNIALATVVGFLKSVVSITLLFIANKASKWVRGVSIV